MSAIKDGGPAFPVPDSDSRGHIECSHIGMTLRDYFAAKASEDDIKAHRTTDGSGLYIGSREEAKFAYADAMLAAREAGQ